ncbi:MAG: trehalose-phosphatase [Dehalococcoidales bacterium]|nr:trehalose-phosphatase [Dehalococcoidales bacterium]
MRYLFDAWASFAKEVCAAAHVLLVSDYDGTLTPIVNRPEEALLSLVVKSKLELLATRPAFSLGIISGRALAEIRAMVGIEGIYYAGNHGMEITGPCLNFTNPEAAKAKGIIRQLAGELSAKLSQIKGIIVEDKGFGLSVHYRMVAPSEVKEAENIFQQLSEPLVAAGKIRMTAGKKVWEIRPPFDWNKGKAVALIINDVKTRLKPDSLLVIYLGDDATDEDVFRMLRGEREWGIFVRGEKQSTSADYFLNDTGDVEDLLARLLKLK